MQVLQLYRVHQWDGGERTNATDIYFTEQKAADDYKAANKFDTVIKNNLVLCASLDEYESFKLNAIKERAMSKLSVEEKYALGLLK